MVVSSSLRSALLLSGWLGFSGIALGNPAAPSGSTPLGADAVPEQAAETKATQASQSVVSIVLHTRLTSAQREALQLSFEWQLRSLDMQPQFSKATTERPRHDPKALATLWLVVEEADWRMYIFDGKSSYTRTLSGANHDAAAIEAAVIIAQRSLSAIAEGRPPQMDPFLEAPPDLPEAPPPRARPVPTQPKLPSKPPDSARAPVFAAHVGLAWATFAREVSASLAPVVGVQGQSSDGFALRAQFTQHDPARVASGFGNLVLERRAGTLLVGYWHEHEAWAVGGFAGVAAEFWTRSATAKRVDVSTTADTRRVIWVPSAEVILAWVLHRNIAPYLSLGGAAPQEQPRFSSNAEGRIPLLTPNAARGAASVGVSFRLP